VPPANQLDSGFGRQGLARDSVCASTIGDLGTALAQCLERSRLILPLKESAVNGTHVPTPPARHRVWPLTMKGWRSDGDPDFGLRGGSFRIQPSD